MNDPITQIEATLTVRVPLSATGSLADGAVRVVERIDAVDEVVDAEIQQVSPGLNDTTVDLRVRIAFDDEGGPDPGPDPDRIVQRERELEAGVGVRDVDRVEAVEPDAPPVMEVG